MASLLILQHSEVYQIFNSFYVLSESDLLRMSNGMKSSSSPLDVLPTRF